MRRFTVFVLTLLLSSPCISFAQTEEAETAIRKANAEVVQLGGDSKYAKGLQLARQTLEHAEKEFGPEHPDTLASLNKLASLFQDQGRYGEAEPLYKRALETRERVLGPEHPDTLTSLNNLALLYQLRGRYDEAGQSTPRPAKKKTFLCRRYSVMPLPLSLRRSPPI